MKFWRVILLLLTMAPILAEDGSAVVVVYNSKMPASKSLAEYYALKRAVPAEQVIGLPLPEKEAISRDDYQKELLEPFLKRLQDQQLMTFTSRKYTNAAGAEQEALLVSQSKIRYAALCFGVPVKIEQDSRVHEANAENAPAIAIRNEAAIDSELALAPMHYAKLSINGPIANRFYAATNLAAMHPTNGLLMVTRLDGPTVEIARGLIDKSLQAERDGLWGRAYFDMRGLTSGEYKLGDDMLKAAEKNVARNGFETIRDDSGTVFPAAFPMPQIAIYAGWYEFNVTGALAQPVVEFMPGAFAYHLHSFSAELVRSPSERWLGPLLSKGAACSMGAVYEPFLQGTPDIAVYLGRWLFDGATFAEAAYTSQKVLSWQITVVGTALYRPFAKKPQQQHEELEKANSKLLEWSLLRVVNINLATDLPAEQAISFLREQPHTKTSSLLSEKLGDLLKASGKWIDAVDVYERALKLETSPQQRLRISLLLAVMETSLDRGRQAYEIYQGLLRDYPDFPDKLKIYQKILPLADQFGKPGESADYARALKELTPKS